MTNSFVQVAHSTTTPQITGVTQGNFLAVGVITFDSAEGASTPLITSITDSTGDTWAKATDVDLYGGSLELWYCTQSAGAAAGTHTLTITYASTLTGTPTFDYTLVEYSPQGLVDQAASNYSSGAATVTLSTSAVAEAGELGIMFAGAAGGADWPLVATTINGSAATQRNSVTDNFGANSWWGDTLSLPSGTQAAVGEAQSGAGPEFGVAFATFKLATPIRRVQQVVNIAETATAATSWTIPFTPSRATLAGNRIVLAIGLGAGSTVTGITDTKGNTYTVDNPGPSTGANQNAVFASAEITTPITSSDTFTLTLSTATKPEIVGWEYNGIASSSPVESTLVAGGGSGTGTTTNTQTFTPAAATSQLFANVSYSGTGVISDGQGNFSSVGSTSSNALLDDLNNTGTTSINSKFNWSGSGKWAFAGVVYRAAGSGPTPIEGAASFSFTFGVTAAARVAHTRSASLSAAMSLTASARVIHQRSARLAATFTLTARQSGGPPSIWLPITTGLKIPQPAAAMKGKTLGAVLDLNTTTVVLSAQRGLDGDALVGLEGRRDDRAR